MQPVRVSCVSYINSAPFVYGLRQLELSGDIILSLDNPSDCAAKLRHGLVDIGLIPVAAIASVTGAKEISDWCIASDGRVKSVTLLSDVPLDEIKFIYPDFQSVTSNLLTRILVSKYWKITPVFLTPQQGFEQIIQGETAGVVIGDRSLLLQHKYKYVYDLSEEWKNFTGLPFVFARWVSNKKLPDEFLKKFNDALSFGIDHMADVIYKLKSEPGFQQGTENYLLNNLSYNFNSLKKQGMDLYLDYAASFSNSEIRELQ
jgi:chorismate dehydratase